MGKMRISPVIAFSIHDPNGLLFPHLWKITPVLKENFSKSFVGITPVTLQNQKSEVEMLTKDPFFNITYSKEGSLPGDHFVSVYQSVVKTCPPNTVVHLGVQDRLSYILETEFKKQALKDFLEATLASHPTLFQRTPKAWSTYPKNYFAAESMVRQAGKILFNKNLDFFWCHLVLRASDLQEILPKIESHDFTVFPEIVFYLKEKIKTKDVDWLSWEDPFIFHKNHHQLKLVREQSREETDKRLQYVIPVIKMLFDKYYQFKRESNEIF